MSTDLTFIANKSGQALLDRFNDLLKEDTYLFDCLVDYFFLNGFYKLYPSLEKTEKNRSLGTGTNKILQWCREWGLPDPVFEYTGTSIVVTLKKNPVTLSKGMRKTVEKTVEKILTLIKANPRITQKEIMKRTGLTRRGVEWNLRKLKETGRIRRVGSDRGGRWGVL